MKVVDNLRYLSSWWNGFWAERSAREQKQILATLCILILALIYALLVEPALTGRVRLQKSLPELRQQAAEMETLAKTAVTLSNTQAAPVAPASKEMLEAELARKGLKSQSLLVTGDFIKVELPSVSYAGLMGWLDEMKKVARLTVTEANVTALKQPDMVNATVTLRQQKSE